MNIWELLLIAVGLSMDAFAIAICVGLTQKQFRAKDALRVGLFFGAAQAIMPAIGYLIGAAFADRIERWDHFIAFGLLAFIGVKMLIESRSEEKNLGEDTLRFGKIFLLAIATSIDALAVGVSFAFLDVSIAPSALLIGVITFTLATIGVRIGFAFGARLRSWATVGGGIVLIAIGIKILLEHTLLS